MIIRRGQLPRYLMLLKLRQGLETLDACVYKWFAVNGVRHALHDKLNKADLESS